MCLQGKIKTKNIPKSKAIIAYKIVELDSDTKRYHPLYYDADPFKRGINITDDPGYHAYREKDAAFVHKDFHTRKVIKVRLWGRVRYGRQDWDDAVSATHMEIKSFREVAR